MQGPGLLDDGQNVVAQPVQHETGGEVDEHDREHDGHDHHDLALLGVAHGGAQPLLQEHGGTHDERRDVEGVLHGKVGQPEQIGAGQVGDEGTRAAE